MKPNSSSTTTPRRDWRRCMLCLESTPMNTRAPTTSTRKNTHGTHLPVHQCCICHSAFLGFHQWPCSRWFATKNTHLAHGEAYLSHPES
ncbi:hypothetical protein E2C01_032614 [Portunus trituberculatus]|uniref:Uncharacterized protein n=1 Tax=Portunus trituberculatus TaxID=210409 RepID=A0A5B7F036_PORTR|nr:hypothetical protein [Portunus trituberculatus]